MYLYKSSNMKKTTLFIACILCFSGSVNAQFLKKLGKKVEQAAGKAIERKAERKATKETEKAFDSTFNRKKKNKQRTSRSAGISKVKSAETYAFNHKAEMQFITKKEKMTVNYFLPDSGNFFGMEIKDEKIKDDFIMVYDVDREAMFTYMENNGQKMKMSVAFETDDVDTEDTSFNITATGKVKTILGYSCKEYKMTGDDITATIWVTKDVDIRFPSTLYTSKKNKNNHQEWMKHIDGWAMEMEMTEEMKNLIQLLMCFAFLYSCNNPTPETKSDLKNLFEMEVKNASKDMLKVKDVTQLTKTADITSLNDEKMVSVDYEITLELTEDAWRLVDKNNKGSSHYQLYKSKPKPLDYYGRGTTPKLFKKGDTYKIVRTLKRLRSSL